MVAQQVETGLYPGRFEVENYCRVKVFSVDLRGKHLVLKGPNGSGKSSVLNAFWQTLMKSAKKVDEPVHHGASKATTRLELLDGHGAVRFRVEREFTADGTKLTVRGADGQRYSRPQEMLDRFLNEYAMDISVFLKARPRDQVNELLRVCQVLPPEAEVLEIAGEAFPAHQGESAFAYLDRIAGDKTGVFYDRRAQRGKTLNEKRAALAEAQQEANRLYEAGGGDLPDVTLDGVLGQIAELQEGAERRRQMIAAAAAMRARYNGGLNKVAGLRQELGKKRAEIEELEARLARAHKDQADVEMRIGTTEEELGRYLAQVETAETSANCMLDPAPAIANMREQVRGLESRRAEVLKRRQAGERLEQLGADTEAARLEHAKIELILTRLRALPAALLEKLNLGIDGLEVTATELRLGGVPLAQASQAEQIRVACALAFALKPELKVLRLDDAEHLDDKSRQLLLDLANKQGFQCLIACVERAAEEMSFELLEAA